MKIELIALMGFLLSAISHLAEILSEGKCEGKTKLQVTTIIFTKSFLGACVALIVFYGLTDFFPHISLELRLGISAFCAFFSESISFYALRLLKKRIEKNV